MIPEVRASIASLLGGQPAAKWKGIVFHHSATADNKKAHDIAAIRLFHKSYVVDDKIVTQEQYEQKVLEGYRPKGLMRAPWQDVAYHFLLEHRNDKLVWEFGRSLEVPGSHTKGFNNTHLGICLVGNFSKKNPNMEQWRDCLEITRIFMNYFEIQHEQVLGHWETFVIRGVSVEKDCPGAAWDMNKFRNDI